MIGRWWVLLLAAGLGWGCPQDAAKRPAAPRVAIEEGATAAAEEPVPAAASDLEAGERRERSGIEAGRPAGPARPVARLKDEDPGLRVPALRETPGPARSALERVAQWRAEQEAKGARITIVAPEVRLSPPPAPTATVTFHELLEGDGGCQEGRRSLTLRSEEDAGPWELQVDEDLGHAPCRDGRPGLIAGTHEALRIAWDAKDHKKLREGVAASVWVRDFGQPALELTEEALTAGEGRWALAALAGVEAERDNSVALSAVGVVRGDDARFVYERRGGMWVLIGVERGALPRGLTGRAAAPTPP